jgi:hypothetical protein
MQELVKGHNPHLWLFSGPLRYHHYYFQLFFLFIHFQKFVGLFTTQEREKKCRPKWNEKLGRGTHKIASTSQSAPENQTNVSQKSHNKHYKNNLLNGLPQKR